MIGPIEQDLADLAVARQLAENGIPVFVARPNPSRSTGFDLPTGWQHTKSDPAVLDRWRPGWAVCMVTGHGVDVLDVDPRNGGDVAYQRLVAEKIWPMTYGRVTTPSGGFHDFIVSLGLRKSSRDGIDHQGGHDGAGHGFVFLPPTVRTSKVTGQPSPYAWVA